jgi:hypothetical protein
MQVIHNKARSSIKVQRDMDLIRDLLLSIEKDATLDGSRYVVFNDPKEFGDHTIEEITYHVDLLMEAGLVKGDVGGELPIVSRLTWQGHEFLADTSDSGVWANVKERTKGLPNVAIALVWELAKAELRKKLGL